MKFEKDESLPDNCSMIKLKDGNLEFHLTNLSRDITCLRYPLVERLSHAKKILNKHKGKNLNKFFLKEDIEIIKRIEHPTNDFLGDIIERNLIKYTNSPAKNINELIDNKVLEKYDRNPVLYLTKWIKIPENESLKKKVFNNIKNNFIFASFPSSFNDPFDAQLRCSNELIEELAKKYVNLKTNGYISEFDLLQHKCNFIKFYQEFFNASNIACFSMCDPFNFESHSMWGLYGNSGKGFALQYDLSALNNFFSQETSNLFKDFKFKHTLQSKPNDNSRIFKVSYRDESLYKRFFLPYLNQVIMKVSKNDPPNEWEPITELMIDFYSHKNINWQYEKEVRLVSFNFLINNESVLSDMTKFLNLKDPQHCLLADKTKFYEAEKNILPFIRPSKIILGWNFDYQEDSNFAIVSYAKENNIQLWRLNEHVYYPNNHFEAQQL